MKLLILGCGSIGTRHISNLREIDSTLEIDAFDPKKQLRKDTQKKFQVNTFENIPRNKSDYDLVLICTPPTSHIKLTIDSLQDGSNVFVEKPLSSNLTGISKLQNIIKKNDSLAFIG